MFFWKNAVICCSKMEKTENKLKSLENGEIGWPSYFYDFDSDVPELYKLQNFEREHLEFEKHGNNYF